MENREEVVPESHFCRNCGAKNFTVHKVEKINFNVSGKIKNYFFTYYSGYKRDNSFFLLFGNDSFHYNYISPRCLH